MMRASIHRRTFEHSNNAAFNAAINALFAPPERNIQNSTSAIRLHTIVGCTHGFFFSVRLNFDINSVRMVEESSEIFQDQCFND